MQRRESTLIFAIWFLAPLTPTFHAEAAPLSHSRRQSGLEKLAVLRDELAESPDHDWADWVVLNFSPTRIHFPAWTDQQRQEFLDAYDPDHIGEWAGASLNRGDFARMRGVACNTTHEYGTNEDLNELRGHTIPLMEHNGVGRKENGQLANGGWDRSFIMCHNAPKWHVLQMQSPVRQAVYGDSIFHDKIEAVFRELDHGYCQWCNRRFVQHMVESFSPRDMKRAGFDPEVFQLTDYVRSRRRQLDAQQLLEDPIIHEYIRFQFQSQLYWSVETIKHYHDEARKSGKPIPVYYGNQSGVWGRSPFATVLCDHVDLVWIEQSHTFQRPLDANIQAFSSLKWKLGRAASRRNKPVWGLEYPAGRKDKWPYGLGADKRYPTALANAEAVANGGVPCQNWSATPYYEQEISEALLAGHRHHARFVDAHRELFVDRASVADCALVYSIPSRMWRNCYKLALKETPCLDHFGAAGRLLEDAHAPYEVIVFGHPDVYDDAAVLANLQKYRTIVLPRVDCISNAQVAALVDWTRAGGKLILWGAEEVAVRDEELSPRRASAFRDLIRRPGAGSVESIPAALVDAYLDSGGENGERVVSTAVGSETIASARPKGGASAEDVGTVVAKLAAAVADANEPLLRTDLPPAVWVNVWRHGAGPMTTVQLVNNDLNVPQDSYAPVENFTVSLRVPMETRIEEIYYVNSDYADTDPAAAAERLEFERDGSYVTVRVPRLDMFGIVILSAAGELEARSAAAQARKWRTRLEIATRRTRELRDQYRVLLAKAEEQLRQVQGDAAVDEFSVLTAPLLELRDVLHDALTSVTRASQAAQQTDADEVIAVDAVKKFDFGRTGAPAGWIQVPGDADYSPQQGYGWTDRFQKETIRHGDADPLHRDFVRSLDAKYDAETTKPDAPQNRHFPLTNPGVHPGEFQVDLPNGEYVVTIVTGDYEVYRVDGGPANEGRTAMTQVDAEGVPVLYGDRAQGGVFRQRAFRTRVDDGQLNLTFRGQAVGPFYCNSIEWLVNGVVVQRADQNPTRQAAQSLQYEDLFSRAAIREWCVVGPFDDSDWQGRELDFGPEKSLEQDQTYQGKNGPVRWTEVPRLAGTAPFLSLAEQLGDADQVTGFALTRVYSPEDTTAILVGSMSQLGEMFVNGEVALVDELAAGLLPDEFHTRVRLKRGWNSILVKSSNYWGKEWSLWAGLVTTDRKPLADEPGVKINAAPQADEP